MGILQVLVQFVLRLTFGMALAMGLTPPKLITSGFYRVHLWVLMGMNTFAALTVWSNATAYDTPYGQGATALVGIVGLAVLSFVGAGVWLYEKSQTGMVILYVVSLLSAGLATVTPQALTNSDMGWVIIDVLTGGFLLGIITTAMLLGHWYLNTPTMQLGPIRRLTWLTAVAIIVRSIVCGIGFWLADKSDVTTSFWLFLAFRWLSGIMATAALTGLTWQTLKIPNTQSATGILYAGVILAFLGELTSQLLSVDVAYPL